jgi:hypothetical protein
VTRPRRRAATAGANEHVVFRGPPDRLGSLLRAPTGPRKRAQKGEAGAPARASLEGADVRGLRVRPMVREGGAVSRATLRLPRWTPPGTYTGSAEIDGETVPIVAEVEPRPRLEAEPHRITVEADPGGTAAVELELVNTGNVPCEVPGATTFCVFDGRGLEHAVWAALASDAPKGRERVDVFLDDLSESHGGLVTVNVESGATIAAGESRRVQLTLQFSDRLRPGKRYAGSWRSDGLRVPVRVTTSGARARRKAGAAR